MSKTGQSIVIVLLTCVKSKTGQSIVIVLLTCVRSKNWSIYRHCPAYLCQVQKLVNLWSLFCLPVSGPKTGQSVVIVLLTRVRSKNWSIYRHCSAYPCQVQKLVNLSSLFCLPVSDLNSFLMSPSPVPAPPDEQIYESVTFTTYIFFLPLPFPVSSTN